jgi:hypothetical protein
MVVVEILVVVLSTLLFIVVVAALWVGLLGVIGAVQFARCDRCGHLGLTSASEPLRACIRCRHGRLLHPVVAVHHGHVVHHFPFDRSPRPVRSTARQDVSKHDGR